MVFEEEDGREREREEIVPNLRSNAKVTDEAKTEVGHAGDLFSNTCKEEELFWMLFKRRLSDIYQTRIIPFPTFNPSNHPAGTIV